MDLLLGKKVSNFAVRKNWILLAAFGASSYGAFRVYHSPAIARKRERISRLFGALLSIAGALSYAAEAVSVVSKDLRDFVQSESDQIPTSFKQISKLARSDEFSRALTTATQAFTTGLLRGCRSRSVGSDPENAGSNFVDRVMDKLFTTAGTSFASALVGSFARNLVMALYSDEHHHGFPASNTSHSAETGYLSRWMNVVGTEDCKKLLGDCIQVFVSTAVAVYLDKTMNVNTYDDFFSGLTNPRHQTRVRDVLVSVCNGAVETLVKTSHRIGDSTELCGGVYERPRNFKHIRGDGGWVGRVSTSLASPSNRRFMVDLSGRLTFEMVTALSELLVEKLNKCVRNCVECAMNSGIEAVRCVSVKASVVEGLCMSLCLRILEAPWLFAPNA